MDEKRIKNAEKNFRGYLKDNLIKKEFFHDIVFETYFNNALESLKVAEEIYNNKA